MTTPPPIMQRLPSPPPPPLPPQELMGSTRMDEHHPAYRNGTVREEEGEQQRPFQLHEPVGSPEVVSPVSEEAGRR